VSWNASINLTCPDVVDGPADQRAIGLWANVWGTSEADVCIGMDEVLKLYDERRRWIRSVSGPTRHVNFETNVTVWQAVIRLSYIDEPGPAHALSGDAAPIAHIGLGEAK